MVVSGRPFHPSISMTVIGASVSLALNTTVASTVIGASLSLAFNLLSHPSQDKSF
jgi:hypothetical protein